MRGGGGGGGDEGAFVMMNESFMMHHVSVRAVMSGERLFHDDDVSLCSSF